MSRALILSGGAFRGAIQVPIIEHLKLTHKYDAVYGVSVGAINGAMFAQDDLVNLRELWDNINDVSGFLSLKWYWPFNGLYSMNPMRKKIERYLKLDKMKIPFHAGVVSFTDGEYRNMPSKDMETNLELWDAVQASSCMAGIMVPPIIPIDGSPHVGCDGGFRNIMPIPEDMDYDYLDVVLCTPIDRIKNKEFSKIDVFNIFKRTLEILEDEVFDKDILQLVESRSIVRIFSPNEYPGDSLDASKEIINFRYELGKRAISNPIILTHK